MAETAKRFHYTKLSAEQFNPIQIFRNLTGRKKFLLESTYRHETKGKFSFIGMTPYEEVIGTGGRTMIIQTETGEEKIKEESALSYLKDNLPEIDIDLPVPFFGGAVGYIGYEASRYFIDLDKPLIDDREMPDVHFMLYKDVIVFDHEADEIYLIAVSIGDESEQELLGRVHYLEEVIRIDENQFEEAFSGIEFTPEITKEAFEEKVRIAKEHIERGGISQVVLSQRMKAEIGDNPEFSFAFYQGLRKSNPSPYMFYIDFEDYLILGASPESVVQTRGTEVITNPIAGTRGRGETEAEDIALETELLLDKKEVSEHLMLVDLSANDLCGVCESDSITIPKYMRVEKYEHVMHLVSEVKGKLKENQSSIDALISCLPAGTVSGAPRGKAMQLINQLEEYKRGPYGGGIGYINFNRDLNIALTIRSLVVKDNKAYLQAGAGVVADSVPEKEYEETLNKAKSLLQLEKAESVSL